jgi:Tol biopolymer transport system component
VEPGSTTAADRELYLIDPVTKVVSQLTHNDVNDTFATWSPDYTQIAFAREENGNRDIYIRDLHGEEGSEHALVAGGTDDWFPAWSKDRLVAFARGGSSGPNSATLWVIPSDGGGQPREFLPGVHGRAPAWSTDGKTLAFMSDGNGNKLDVTVVRPGATEPDYLTGGPGDERNPTWSPNDQQIVFVSDADGDQELYLLDIATNTVSPQLTRNNVLDGNPVWSPDGKEIAFFRATSARGYHIWKINIETGKEDDLMPNAVGQNMDPNWR